MNDVENKSNKYNNHNIVNYTTISSFNKNNKFINQKRYKSMLRAVQDQTKPEVIFKELNIDVKDYWTNLYNINERSKMIQQLKNKAAIYIIINKISRNYYIGSANINKIYTTFSKHMINLNGNKIVKKAILKNGLNNFIFAILEYYPTCSSKIDNNNFNYLSNTCSRNLYELETMYLIALLPKYNILREANTSISNIDIDENIQKLKLSFDKERYSLLNKLNTCSLIKTDIINNKFTIPSSNIKLYDINNNYICKFKNANTASHYLCCSYKIIERSLNIGWIYIPTIFSKYLDDNYLSNNNDIVKNLTKSSLYYNNNKDKLVRIKSSLYKLDWNDKYYIRKSD